LPDFEKELFGGHLTGLSRGKAELPRPGFPKRRRREYHIIVYGYQYNRFKTI
jgi:hypothetical protein